jgi:hypothetical protein
VVPTDGSYYVYFACIDAAGNMNTSRTTGFTVDATAPTILANGPSGGNYNSSVTITAVTDVAANCSLSVDGGTGYDGMNIAFANGQGSTSHNTSIGSGLLQGLNLVYIACMDANGMKMDNSVVSYFNYDTVAPNYSATIIFGSAYMALGDTVAVEFVSSEDLASPPTVTFGGVAPSAACTQTGRNFQCEWTFNASFTEGGQDLVISGGQDAAGNFGTALTENDVIYLDLTAPVLTDPFPSTLQTTNFVDVGVDAGETGLACRYSTSNLAFGAMVNGLEDVSGGIYQNIAPLGDGSYTVYFACQDAAGNVGTNHTHFTVDSDGSRFAYYKRLFAGWNALPLPMFILQNNSDAFDSNYTVENVLDVCGVDIDDVGIIYYRNGTACAAQNGSCWQSFVDGDPANDLTEFDDWANAPFWLYMDEDAEFGIPLPP